jgi:hypothetical protein
MCRSFSLFVLGRGKRQWEAVPREPGTVAAIGASPEFKFAQKKRRERERRVRATQAKRQAKRHRLKKCRKKRPRTAAQKRADREIAARPPSATASDDI